MQRHSEFEYSIERIKDDSSEIWIYISDNGSGWEEDIFDWTSDEQYDGPIELIKRIQEKENWTIKNVGELQYSFEEDCNHLMFQMDDLFGFTIVLKDAEKYDSMMNFIKKYIS